MSDALRHLIELASLRPDQPTKIIGGGTNLTFRFPISPEDFLDQAEADYEFGGNAALLNAITNAKRAIVCQIDQVLSCFGYEATRLNYPEKIAKFSAMGFVAPRILRRVNDARNLLEHEYVAPSDGEVTDALDLAGLFVEASKRHLDMFDHEFTLVNRDDINNKWEASKGLSFGYRQELNKLIKQDVAHSFRVAAVGPDPTGQREGHRFFLAPEIVITNTERVFPALVRLVVAGSNATKIERAVAAIFANLARS